MLIDRRTYRILSGHWNEALALITQIRQLSREQMGRDFEILSPRYGPFQTIALEFAFDDDAEQQPFFHEHFYPALRERGWFDGWFSHVLYADAHNLKTVDEDSGPAEKASQAPRQGMLIHRLYHEPVTVGGTWDGSLNILKATRQQFQRNFRITRFHFSGMMTALFWEFCYAGHQEQQAFEDAWYAFLTGNGMLDEYASQVRLGYNELWYSHP